MNADQHPALNTEPEDAPSLTLVLPDHLNKDETLAGLVKAIGKVRTTLAGRARRAQRLVEEFAASGDHLRQAQFRGQLEGATYALDSIDEEIMTAFDLFDQLAAQVPATEGDGEGEAAQQPQHAVEAGPEPEGTGPR